MEVRKKSFAAGSVPIKGFNSNSGVALVFFQKALYKVINAAQLPIDARSGCGSGYELAMPKITQEQTQIEGVLSSASSNLVWAGGKFDTNASVWKWEDGTIMSDGYTNWDNGQGAPSVGASQPWLCIEKETGKWHDCNGINETFSIVCQRQATCPTADFSQSNMAGIQSAAVVGTRVANSYIFSWINSGYRKMVLTNNMGVEQQVGYVSSASATWTDPTTWNDWVGGYSISNVQLCQAR
jgi:hypothetical protein